MKLLNRLKMLGAATKKADESGPLVSELRTVLDPKRVCYDGASRTLLSRDASVFEGGAAGPVCYPTSTDEVQALVAVANKHNASIVPRGAGTGIAGGAIPLGKPIVVALNKMNKVKEVDLENRIAWVEAGVVNLDLSNQLRPLGYHFAPDPSSQVVCTIGGNVANNAGGPHCLAYGVTDAHVVAIEVVMPSGEVVVLGSLEAEPLGYDLRGAFVGGEGTLGIMTKVAVRLTKIPPAVRTMLLSFSSIHDAATTVSDVIAAGIVPAALEVMDQRITTCVEDFVNAGYPRDAAAVLLAEVEGLPGGVELDAKRISEIGVDNGATNVRTAQTEQESQLLWKGRKAAFGAIAQVNPDYYLHDTVVPRSKLADVLEEIYEIADRYDLLVMNLFHAGDGNLHPLLSFDARNEGVIERVHAAGEEILRAAVKAGGVLSGEHGIGVEKQKFMDVMFTSDDMDHQNRLRKSFDPNCRANPGKILPTGHSCADIAALRKIPTGVWG